MQGLMSCAVASSMLSLLIGLFSLCWSSKGCNPYQATGAFANLTCMYTGEGHFFVTEHLTNVASTWAVQQSTYCLISGKAPVAIWKECLIFPKCIERALNKHSIYMNSERGSISAYRWTMPCRNNLLLLRFM